MRVSIIICTRDRAQDLRRTLVTLKDVRVPEDMPTELLIIDNASSDDTAEVVRSCGILNMLVRYIYEPRPGKGYAYNAGMAAARGEVFLFTDDDVRPSLNWIEGMCAPILSGKAHVVAGGVKIAPHLERPWMELPHRRYLASTEWLDPKVPEDIIGANMAFSRAVLDKVPAFDPELGPGALGFGDEALFFLQLKEAGYISISALDVEVEHHFHDSRLTRAAFLDRAKKQGQLLAYLKYHWEHQTVSLPRLRLVKAVLRLTCWRLQNRGELACKEGMAFHEMTLVSGVHFYKQYLLERRRPFNYQRHGLVKLEGL